MKKFILAFLTILLVCFASWCSGYDFNTRGEQAFVTVLASVALPIIVYFMAELP